MNKATLPLCIGEARCLLDQLVASCDVLSAASNQPGELDDSTLRNFCHGMVSLLEKADGHLETAGTLAEVSHG